MGIRTTDGGCLGRDGRQNRGAGSGFAQLAVAGRDGRDVGEGGASGSRDLRRYKMKRRSPRGTEGEEARHRGGLETNVCPCETG